MQAWGVSVRLGSLNANGVPIVPAEVIGFNFTLSTIIVLTAGTMFMMWLGEQITERGIGNGISLIIFIGIIARFPFAVFDEFQLIQSGSRNLIVELFIWAVMIAVTAGVILVTQATRRIPVQYAKRVVGRKVYGGVTQYIPLRVNTAGVMPIIFAQSLMFIPSTVLTFFPESEFAETIASYLNHTSYTYSFFYGLMIVFFTYFYTAIAFNPKDVSENMQKARWLRSGYSPR